MGGDGTVEDATMLMSRTSHLLVQRFASPLGWASTLVWRPAEYLSPCGNWMRLGFSGSRYRAASSGKGQLFHGGASRWTGRHSYRILLKRSQPAYRLRTSFRQIRIHLLTPANSFLSHAALYRRRRWPGKRRDRRDRHRGSRRRGSSAPATSCAAAGGRAVRWCRSRTALEPAARIFPKPRIG